MVGIARWWKLASHLVGKRVEDRKKKGKKKKSKLK